MTQEATPAVTEALGGARTSSLTAPTVQRLDYIDGLRAIAALWVVLHHARETSSPEGLLQLPVLGPVLASVSFGQAAVMVFLVLSGFCLYFPLARKNHAAPELGLSYAAYLLRRAKRIAPPCLWAGLFCLPLATLPIFLIGRWGKEVSPVSFGTVLTHVLFVHNLFPQYANKIDYPMWSVGLEWQLYLLFPFLVWAFRKSNGLLVSGVALLIAAAIRSTYRHFPETIGAFLHDGPFSYLEVFAAGMIAASLTARGRRVAPNWVLGCALAGGLLLVRLGSGNGLLHDIETTVAAVSVLLLAANSKMVHRVLSTPVLVKMGVFSYSIYLVHAPLLHLFWLALRPLQLSADLTFVLLAFGSLPLIVAVSYGFHCFFERPFMRIKPVLPRAA
jgi:peptidoglycan/LPS O-acetylase OafA/YrhL